MDSPSKLMAMSSRRDTLIILASTRDILSSLPDQIIYHIFSFLGANDTARFGVVSKRFNQLCTSSPYLNFVADFDSEYSDPSCLRTRYTDFCSYVNKVLRWREKTGGGLQRLHVHWHSCKKRRFDIGETAVNSWVTIATKCGVEELDMLLHVDPWRGYSLPGCVYNCESLRALKLNLQMGRFNFRVAGWDWLKDLWLDSVTVEDIYFGQRISEWCKSLKRLTLEDVDGISGGLNMTTSSLEELTISGCDFGFTGGNFNISSSSFKTLTIYRCQFKAQRHVNLNCPSLENLTVHDSEFGKCFLCKISCESLEKLRVCGSSFLEACHFRIACPSVGQVMISSCRFAGTCVLNINSFSLQDLTVSECNFSSLGSALQYLPPVKDFQAVPRLRRHIIVKAANLEKLNISSSDEYSYEFPLKIDAPNLKVLWWAGDPVDFSFLKQDMFMSLTSAGIYIEPSCQHKSVESDRHCKRSKSLIYCAAKLLQCLSEARFLRINTWPIEVRTPNTSCSCFWFLLDSIIAFVFLSFCSKELVTIGFFMPQIFFMQNDYPIVFKNLQNLVLLSDGSLADQIPFIASFLKGMPNLKKLIISCFDTSHELSDPNVSLRALLALDSFLHMEHISVVHLLNLLLFLFVVAVD